MPIGFGGSRSRSSPKMVTGWHVLQVDRYSRTKGLPRGRNIKSSIFTVGGHSWSISYFPSGLGIALCSSESLSVELNLHCPAASNEVLTEMNFSILDPAGEKVYSPFSGSSNIIYTFSSNSVSHGIAGFIKKTELESLYVKDDSFKIRCDVTVIMDIDAEESVTVPPSDLHHHLGKLLDSQVGGDVIFKVDGKVFTAHRNVLAARSSVFMAQLFDPVKGKTSSHVRIHDMDARVFGAMLRFIYTDTLPADMEEGDQTAMAQHLLVAADRYGMERLKLICEDILRNRINTDMLASTLLLAEQHGCSGLKNACFKFLVSPGNLRTVMASDSFQHLKNSCPSLVDEILAKVAP